MEIVSHDSIRFALSKWFEPLHMDRPSSPSSLIGNKNSGHIYFFAFASVKSVDGNATKNDKFVRSIINITMGSN
jgi:hypothetical protein